MFNHQSDTEDKVKSQMFQNKIDAGRGSLSNSLEITTVVLVVTENRPIEHKLTMLLFTDYLFFQHCYVDWEGGGRLHASVCVHAQVYACMCLYG